MSFKRKSHDIEAIPMSLQEAESVIYSQEFFNTQRMYTLARKNGETALREAEQNLRHSIRVNFDIKRSFENETSSYDEEIEDLFQNISPNNRENIIKLLSRSCYSKPNSPTFSETQRSLPRSPALHIRSRSLTAERNSPIYGLTETNNSKRFDTFSSTIKDDITGIKNYTNFPLKTHPLHRSSNQCLSQLKPIWSTSNSNHIHLKTTEEIKRSEKGRLNQLMKQSSFPTQHKNMSLMYQSTNIPKLPKAQSFSGTSHNNLQRFSKQLTIQGPAINTPLSRSSTSMNNEDNGKYWTIGTGLGNVRENNFSSGFETEGRLHYYIVGTTNDS